MYSDGNRRPDIDLNQDPVVRELPTFPVTWGGRRLHFILPRRIVDLFDVLDFGHETVRFRPYGIGSREHVSTKLRLGSCTALAANTLHSRRFN